MNGTDRIILQEHLKFKNKIGFDLRRHRSSSSDSSPVTQIPSFTSYMYLVKLLTAPLCHLNDLIQMFPEVATRRRVLLDFCHNSPHPP